MDTQETRLKDQEAISKLKELIDEVSICMFTTLDNETNLKEELKIMNSVALTAFLPAALKQIF